MANQKPSSRLLEKYLAHECSNSEREIVDAWYQSLLLHSEETFSDNDEDRLYLQIRDQISLDSANLQKPIKIRTSWWVYASGIAAALILAVGFLYLKPTLGPLLPVSARTESAVKMTNAGKMVFRYTLPDLSVVWLQPGATVEHARSFDGREKREIRFEGEGFFEVTRDVKHPFIIQSGKLKTEVLGTSFNIKANKNDLTYRVSVVSGSVAVSTSDPDQAATILLKPQQQAVFETTTNNLSLNNLKTKKSDVETWQPVSLRFDDAPLSAIVTRLQKTFHVKIDIANPVLKDCELKVDFDKQNLPEILEMINALLGSTYEINGDTITLSGEGCGGR
jgi:transmembrane sensor